MVAALQKLKPAQFVLDGEIVILQDGHLSFDDLLLRIHPAASRIQQLSKETPATYLLFDLLVDEKGKSLVERPLSERRKQLERLVKSFGKQESIRLVSGDARLRHGTALDDGAGGQRLRWRGGERNSTAPMPRASARRCARSSASAPPIA